MQRNLIIAEMLTQLDYMEKQFEHILHHILFNHTEI